MNDITIGNYTATLDETTGAVSVTWQHGEEQVDLFSVLGEDVRDLVALLALINPGDNPLLLSTSAAIERKLDASKSTIRNWIRDDRVPGVFRVAKLSQVDFAIVEDLTPSMVDRPTPGNPNFGSDFSKRVAKRRKTASAEMLEAEVA